MIFQRLIRNSLYFMLYAGCVLLNVGCAMPMDAFAEDGENFPPWEVEISDKTKLTWYFYTKKNYSMNQPDKVRIHNKEFLVHSDVRPPTINGAYLLEYATVNEGEEVLDIGTGSGVHAAFAAEKARRVVATDIYAPAIANAKVNAELHGVEDKIDFRVGDLFGPINTGEKFDVFFININLPFEPSDRKRNELHERLFSEIHQYMKPNARIYFQTSFIKNIPYIYDMLSRNNLEIMEMHMEHMYPSRHEPLFIMIQSH